MRKDLNFEYDIAISYASEDEDIAKELFYHLKTLGVRVWYSPHRKTGLWGKNLSDWFRQVYGPKTRYVLVLVSLHYAVKDWTSFEFDIARGEAKKRTEEFILPIRLDDTLLVGLRSDVGYLDFWKEGIEGVVDHVLGKLGKHPLTWRQNRGIFVATLGVDISELEESKGLTLVPAYLETCDRMERVLTKRLKDSSLAPVLVTEPSLRDGEGLSVRFAFYWDMNDGNPRFDSLGPWELLELRPVHEVYPEDFHDIERWFRYQTLGK